MKKIIMFITSLLIMSASYAFVAQGTAVLTSEEGLDKIGFTFNTETITGNTGDFYYYEGDLWTNHLTAGIKDMGSADVSTCDITGYKPNVKAVDGNTYCIKTSEGSYAKIKITSLSSNTLSMTWKHQRDGTNAFPEEKTETAVPEALDINYALIIIIIVLVIIIFLIWKYR